MKVLSVDPPIWFDVVVSDMESPVRRHVDDFKQLQNCLPTMRRATLTSEAKVLQEWLVKVIEKLKDREIHDEGVAKIYQFLGIEEEDEYERLETELVALRQSSSRIQRALVAANEESATLIAVLRSECDDFKRQVEDISQRHADLLLHVGGQQLEAKVVNDSRFCYPPPPPPPGRPSLILADKLPKPICCFISVCGQV